MTLLQLSCSWPHAPPPKPRTTYSRLRSASLSVFCAVRGTGAVIKSVLRSMPARYLCPLSRFRKNSREPPLTHRRSAPAGQRSPQEFDIRTLYVESSARIRSEERRVGKEC